MRPSMIACAHAAADRRSNLQQRAVARQVAVAIVDALEMIGVDDQQGAAHGGPAARLEGGKEAFAVEHAGHVVAAGLLQQAAMRRRQLGMDLLELSVGGGKLLVLPEGEGAAGPGNQQGAERRHQPGILIERAADGRHDGSGQQDGSDGGENGDENRLRCDDPHLPLPRPAGPWPTGLNAVFQRCLKFERSAGFPHAGWRVRQRR